MIRDRAVPRGSAASLCAAALVLSAACSRAGHSGAAPGAAPEAGSGSAADATTCARAITAHVVALEQVYTYNRLGAFNPEGLVFALRRDVAAITPGTAPGPGNAVLRPGKRPRPLVLRANVGDCLTVTFENWLAPTRGQIPSILRIRSATPPTCARRRSSRRPGPPPST
jgi:manganese oxidase